MSENLDTDLAAALQRLAQRAPSGPLDAGRVRHAVRRRRMMIAGPIAVVLAVTAILAGVLLTQPRDHAVAGPPATSACAPLQTGPIPVWARAGFTADSYPPFATSSGGDVVAIVFGDPLSAPPAADHHNKILWVGRDGAGFEPRVTARLEGSNTVVTRDIPTGPSIVDMPKPGCWQLDLQVGNRQETINLRWTRP